MDERIDQIVDLPVPVVNKVLFDEYESDDENEEFWGMIELALILRCRME